MGIGVAGWNNPSWREVGEPQAAAPVTAKFLTQQPDGTLTGEQALSLLATGLMKSTTGTGVVSIAVANTDYAHPGATYVVKTSTNAPPNAQILAALGTGIMKNANGTGVVSIAVSNDDFAAPGATYIVKTASAAPTNAQVLASLATGLVKNTTATGVLSVAVGGTDYVVPGGVAGGQTIVGGTAASETLTLRSTSDPTKGSIIVGTTSGVVFDGLNSNLMIGHSTVAAPTRLSVLGSATVASATSATWNGVDFIASTLTLSGNTAITTQTGVNFTVVRAPTLSAASALTVTHAASFYVSAAPTAAGAGPATITNAWAARIDGKTLVGGGAFETPVVGTAPLQIFNAGNAFMIVRDSTNHVEACLGNAGSTGIVGTQTSHSLGLSAGNSTKVTITTGGLVGIGSVPVARLEVITDTDTNNGAPTTYDGKYCIFGPSGGATGSAVYISYRTSSNIGYIGSLTPGTGWRTLALQVGGGTLTLGGSGSTVNISTSISVQSTTMTFLDATSIAFNTTTGTKIGTGTTQKIGFWNAAPVVQQTVTGSRATTAALVSLLTALALEGLIVDSSTA